MDYLNIDIEKEKVERLKKVIILKESSNLKTRDLSDPQMVEWIRKKIEEEIQCYSNL